MPKEEEEHVFVGRTSGDTRLILRVMEAGDDFIFLLTGGDAPHIGAIAVGIPRPSLANPSVTSASVSVFVLTSHKDDELAKPLAMEAACIFGRVVVAVAGIHVNAPSMQEITEYRNNTNHKGIMMNEIVLGITGASGAIYGLRMLTILKELGISAHLILLSNRRFCIVKTSEIFGKREAAVRRWIERFEQGGIDSLCNTPRCGRPPKVAADVLPIIERDVISSPASHGYLFRIWTTINTSVHLAFKYEIEISETTCRGILGILDFRHNRSRHGPTKASDPLVREEPKGILGILSSRASDNHMVGLSPSGRIHIIFDNYSIHKAKIVEEWLTNYPRVKLHCLPCYMP